jgi:hypothetical protein
MYKTGFILAAVICSNAALFAQNSSIPEAGIILDGILYTEPGNSLHNKVIKKTTAQSFSVTSAFVKTTRNISVGNVCKGYLFYRLFKENVTPPPFTVVSCTFASNIFGSQPGFQDQLWLNNSFNLDLKKGLDTGRYSFQFYYGADAIDNVTGCNNSASVFLQNGTEPFKATLVITPPLMMNFTGFSAKTDNVKVALYWTIDNPAAELDYFIVEKSENGVAWTALDTIYKSGVEYLFIDDNPAEGVNFYRVNAVGSGKSSLSNVRRIYKNRVENIITVYPNPVYRNLRFQMTGIIAGKYEIAVYNSDGKRIISGSINHDGSNNYLTFPLPPNLSRGIFQVVIYSKREFYKKSFFVER